MCNEEKRQTTKRVFGIKTHARNWIFNLVFLPGKCVPTEIYSFTRHDGWTYTTVGDPHRRVPGVKQHWRRTEKFRRNHAILFRIELSAGCTLYSRITYKSGDENKWELAKKRLQR